MNVVVPPTISLAQVPVALAPLALLLGAMLAPVLARRAAALHAVAIGGPALAALVLLAGASRALGGELVLSHASRLFRAGSLDANLGFAVSRTPLVAALVLLALVGAAAHDRCKAEARPRGLSALLVAVAGAITALLAEGVPTLLFGLGVAYLAAARASADEEVAPARPSWAAPLGFASSVLFACAAFALVFWSLGGRWLDDSKYLSDYRARFVAESPEGVPKRDALATPLARGTLTVLSHPGAKVYLGLADESQLARTDVFAETPFVKKELPAGLHKIAIAPGGGALIGSDGLEVALLDAVSIVPNQETKVRLQGPSLTFHEMAPQLGADLYSRRLGPFQVMTAIAACVALALLSLVLAFVSSSRGGGATAAGACALGAAAALASQLGALAPIMLAYQAPKAPLLGALAALALAGVAIVAAARGLLGATLAAALAVAALAPAQGSAVLLATALLPGLVALAPSAAAQAAAPAEDTKPAPRAEEAAAPRTRKKKKAKARPAEEPVVAPAPQVSATWLRPELLALAGMPWPLLGPFVVFSGLILTALSHRSATVAVAAGAALSWAALAHAAGRRVGRAPSSGLRGALAIVALLASVAAPLVALTDGAWREPPECQRYAWSSLLLLGLGPWLVARVAFAHGQSRPGEPAAAGTGDRVEATPSPLGARLATLVRSLDAIASLPTSWVEGVLASKVAADDAKEGER